MRRDIYAKLLEWRNKSNRKPLVVNGARQVGKTFILKEFGKNEYKKVAFVSLDRNKKACEVFERTTDVGDILLALSALSGVDITPSDTLLILDEVQDCPKALQALKYFCEDAPWLHVAVAGSLLGLSIHGGVSYPVGKVDELRLYPMSFEEFLDANGKNRLADHLRGSNWSVVDLLHEEYVSMLRKYYYVGGMPAAVLSFAQGAGLQEVRRIQQQILVDYKRDFSKHAPLNEVSRINMVWDSIPSQLAKENKKFIYGALKSGARAKDFEMAIQWLEDAGLVYKVPRANQPQLPLKFYQDPSAFKLYMLDVGLMGAMVGASAETMLVGNSFFSEYKGAFSELYVFTQLLLRAVPVFYHSVDKSTIEVDFVVQYDDRVIPVEVKAEDNVKSKSLNTFIGNNPHLKGVRFSMFPRRDQEWMTNYPLYAVGAIFDK